MKRTFLLPLTILMTIALCLIGCHDSDIEDRGTGISVSPKEIRTNDIEDEFSVSLKSLSAWSATVNKDWVTITPNSGQGDAFVKINADNYCADMATVVFSNGSGSATLKIRLGMPESIRFELQQVSLSVNQTTLLDVICTPEEIEEGYINFTWTSSDPSVVSVNDKGEIKGLKAGRATINATFLDLQATCVVEVSANPQASIKELNGAFSVAAGMQVHFSAGNLQYQASTNYWQAAEHQYDFIGQGNENISPIYDGWIDLFGWGTGNNPTETSIYYGDYQTFVDWGTVVSESSSANPWRTLIPAEWTYLFYGRANATELFGLGTVNGVNGLILLPDNWTLPSGMSFASCVAKGMRDSEGKFYGDDDWYANHYTDNSYSAAEWETMEAAGAVFLPEAGSRFGKEMNPLQQGYYWASEQEGVLGVRYLYFSPSTVYPSWGWVDDYPGYSVRLVR